MTKPSREFVDVITDTKGTSDLINRISRNPKIEKDLSSAIEKNELEILYQPVFGKDMRMLGYESLVRWNSRDVGIIEPLDLLPLAEKAGMLDEIEEWVLFTAMKTSKSWCDAGNSCDQIFINISPLQIKPGLAEIVENALINSGFTPEKLVIELSENILDEHLHKNRHVMERLCGLGVQLAIDDFGSGHLSLEPIKLFPIKYIKLDKSLINKVPPDTENETVLNVIFALGQTTPILIIGEGIESQQQFDWLADRGCDYFQGFMLSAPLTVDEVLNKK